jgi:hypothetical protein
MNLRRGFWRITLVLAIVTSVICGVFAGIIPFEKYRTAQSHWWYWMDAALIIKRPSDEELKEFKKWRQENISPDIKVDFNVVPDTEQSLEDVREELLAKQKEKFWKDLPKVGLVAIVILYGLGGAAVGYIGVWFIVWFGGLAIYKLIRWIVLGFRDDIRRR